MKTLSYISIILFLISCGQKSNNLTANALKVINQDSIQQVLPSSEKSKIEFKTYAANGMFLKGNIRLFDNNLKNIGKIEIDKTTLVQILEKSDKMYNIEGSTENCDKAYFLKVKYQNKDYTVFGQDVYEINNEQKLSTTNDKKEKLTIFPITNFEMGASDDVGLTACDDYSLLILFNEKKNHYSLMRCPSNEEVHNTETNKYARLFHDEGSEEKIYKLTVKQDTLIIGIKAVYQEGGSVFNLKVKLSDEMPTTKISDRIRFDTDEELKKMDEMK